MAADSTATSGRSRSARWPQRLTIAAAFLCALACFTAAGALYAGQRVIEDRNLAPAIIDPSTITHRRAGRRLHRHRQRGGRARTPRPRTPPTFPPAEPGAKNFLITGADNNSCVDPDSPHAPALRRPVDLGERSDTIMMWRDQPGNVAGRRAVVPPRPVGHDRRPVEPAAHQRRVRAGQPAAS